jgi:hypothetical protein
MSSNLVNKLWYLLVAVSGGIAFWFSVLALWGAWKYVELDAKVAAKINEMQVEERSSSCFNLRAQYVYEVDKKIYFGETGFSDPCYLNRASAEANLKKMQSFSWEAWYKSSDPSVSSLQRVFPFKTCVYAILTLGVFIYFFILRYFTFSRSRWKKDL